MSQLPPYLIAFAFGLGVDTVTRRRRGDGQSVRPQADRCPTSNRTNRGELRFPPPFSPDFKPIERAFAPFRAALKKIAARTVDDLWNAIADAIDLFMPTECENSFAAVGYDRK